VVGAAATVVVVVVVVAVVAVAALVVVTFVVVEVAASVVALAATAVAVVLTVIPARGNGMPSALSLRSGFVPLATLLVLFCVSVFRLFVVSACLVSCFCLHWCCCFTPVAQVPPGQLFVFKLCVSPHGDPGFSVAAFVVHITRGTLMSLVSASVLETLSVVCFVMCVEDVVGCVFASLWPDCPCNTRVHVHDSFLCAVELPVSHSLVGFHLSDGRCIPCAGAASRCENARPLHP
jgi:hypothetical protein